MKLVIADDHPIVLDGVEALLRGSPFTVVKRCGNGEEVLDALNTHRPELLVLDVGMARLNGLDVLRAAKEERLGIKVVLLTAKLSDDGVAEALRLGVDGVVLKATASHRLLECLETVKNGGRWLDPDFLVRLVRIGDGKPVPDRGLLTRREREVARLVTLGLRNKQIAYELSVSEATVKMHLHLMYQKLGLGSRTELALFARSSGIS